VQYLDSHSDAEQFIRVRTERLRDSLATDGAPTVRAAHDQTLGVGDLIISRNNDATIEVPRGAGHRGGVDQVRNGNRWRVAGIDPTTNRVAAERTTDKARVVFGGYYLPEHVTLGYAVTVHSAQGVTVGGNDTAGVCHSIMGEGAARAKDENHAYIYQRLGGESDYEHSRPISGADITSRAGATNTPPRTTSG
jgi:hypothetical protein